MILEGTYPFVQGGVSSWVHNLIVALPDISFTLLNLSASSRETYKLKYTLPPNVVELRQHFVQDYREEILRPGPGGRRRFRRGEAIAALEEFHHQLFREDAQVDFETIYRLIGDEERRVVGARDLYASRASWDLLTRLYEERSPDASFVDFYWTWRFTHVPLFSLMQAPVPAARVYHTVSTGYAGLLGTIAKLRHGRPLVVTEHGLYTRERAMEIAQAQWIYVKQENQYRVERTQSFFKQWWIDLFRFMSKVTYQHSDKILTITRGNHEAQLRDGADPARSTVIPNGVKLERYAPLRELRAPEHRPDSDGFVVGFVGRVVPIKDVKTFIRAIKIAAEMIPDLKAVIVGPTDEDEEYVQDCRRLVSMLDLDDVIRFTGRQDVTEVYPRIDVLVLTSLSEAQPLVLLEANCAGVPAVASNVGACEELLYGLSPADRALGPSGIVTAVASPGETAEAIVRLWSDPELADRMATAGARRVELFYREEDVNSRYRALYRELIEHEPTDAIGGEAADGPPLRCPFARAAAAGRREG